MSKLVLRKRPGMDNLRTRLMEVEGKTASQNRPSTILADCSASMMISDALNKADEKVTRANALREILETDFPTQEVIYFAEDYQFSTGKHAKAFCATDRLGYGTVLTPAIRSAKLKNHTSIVIISDGLPSDPEAALLACKGITAHSIYIGDPDRYPKFFISLAAQQKAENLHSQHSKMRWDETKLLTSTIKGLLG